LQVYEVLSLCTVATICCNTASWHYEEIKSAVAWFSPIKPIHVEVTLYLGQTDPGGWDVESAGNVSRHRPRPIGSAVLTNGGTLGFELQTTAQNNTFLFISVLHI